MAPGGAEPGPVGMLEGRGDGDAGWPGWASRPSWEHPATANTPATKTAPTHRGDP